MTFTHIAGSWESPDSWTSIDVIDAHTAGEPLRIFGLEAPGLSSGPIAERRTWAQEHADDIRRITMWEPRGHREMYGCLMMPPERPDSDVGVLFLHNEGFSTMCGHGIIALATVMVKARMMKVIEPVTTIRIDTPAGLIVADVAVNGGNPLDVTFENVPSYLLHRDVSIDLPERNDIRLDVAFGGAFYAYVDAAQFGLSCTQEDVDELVRLGTEIKRAVSASLPIDHPTDPSLGFLYGTIFVAPAGDPSRHSRNVCIFADGQVDRSPTGTGVSGRLAIHAARGELAIGESITIESILGTTFDCEIAHETHVGQIPAIVPRVTGRAFITGRQTLLLDPDDPLRKGFLL